MLENNHIVQFIGHRKRSLDGRPERKLRSDSNNGFDEPEKIVLWSGCYGKGELGGKVKLKEI